MKKGTSSRLFIGILVGAIGILAIQMLLIGGFLAVSNQDPLILNPNSGSLVKHGLTMVVLCGGGYTPKGRHSELLTKMPPNGDTGGWSRGREVMSDFQKNCDIWYHHNDHYNPFGEGKFI